MVADVPHRAALRSAGVSHGSRRGRTLLQRYLRNRAAAAGTILIAAIILSALLAPMIAPTDPFSQSLGTTLRGPTLAHWFGTDSLGRDIFSRVVRGGRITLPVAFVGVLAALITGIPLGLVAVYR